MSAGTVTGGAGRLRKEGPGAGAGQAPGPGNGSRPDRAGAGLDTPTAGSLAVLARAHWPEGAGDALPSIPGFVVSSFSPLVAEAARRCLRSFFGDPPADPRRGQRTAIVIASGTGDLATASAVAAAVDEGRRVPPLLFFQSNHNAVAGHIAARWGLAGPVLCTICDGDPLADAWSSASLLVEDGDADAVLIIVADQARSAGDADRAVALLAGPASWRPAPTPADRANGRGD